MAYPCVVSGLHFNYLEDIIYQILGNTAPVQHKLHIPYIVDFPLGKLIKITLSKPRFVTNGYQKKVGQPSTKFECGQCSLEYANSKRIPKIPRQMGGKRNMKAKYSSENKARKGCHFFHAVTSKSGPDSKHFRILG